MLVKTIAMKCLPLHENLIGNLELPCASVSKRVLLKKLSYENEFVLHENEAVEETNLHMDGVV